MKLEDQATSYVNENECKADQRRIKIREIKRNIRIAWHALFWRTIWAIGLGRAYSRLACNLGLYEKFPDGRCMYCGLHK